jgi:hypothetical protein
VEFKPGQKEISRTKKHFLVNIISPNFVNSHMCGYLEKRSESWFKSWTEKFCVLTNVGLLYYNDPVKRPRNLFPTIDAVIDHVPESVYNRKFVFRMSTFAFNIVFAAKSKQEYDSWITGFSLLKFETDKKREEMMEE